MDAGGLAQMTSSPFNPGHGLAVSSNLATRRGSQNIKPLSFDAIKQGTTNGEGGVPTPRTSRSHLLAGLRTAPKSASAASFNRPATPQHHAQRSVARTLHGYGQDNVGHAAPKTAFPQLGVQHGSYQNVGQGAHYTVDQVLAPPELAMDDHTQGNMDPSFYAQLVATNMFLAQQQQRLQQQLRSVQAAAQQYQQYNLGSAQLSQQQMALYEHQQQLSNMQQQLGVQAAMSQGQQVYYSPLTGQYYVDAGAPTSAAPAAPLYAEQPPSPMFNREMQQQVYQASAQGTPRLQVSPPPETSQATAHATSTTPPRRYDSPAEVTPLPPPSATAFRRGHKNVPSSASATNTFGISGLAGDVPRSAGPRPTSFPLTPLNGGHGPGQARAGEHPIRQPRGPPSLDELKSKPTARHEGSKNFATRTRRSAVHNLVRAGLERRKGTFTPNGSMSPVSETADDTGFTITDNESDSGRSGSGSLVGEEECTSSRTSASGSWGAIGSDRPSSQQKARGSTDSISAVGSMPSDDAENGSFANVFKHGALRATSKTSDGVDVHRKAPRLVLTSVGKQRKTTPPA